MEAEIESAQKSREKQAKKLDREISSLVRERTRLHECRYISSSCLKLLRFLRTVGFDFDRLASRLTPRQICRCWAHALLFAYLGPNTGDVADHFLWRTRKVREMAYDILGRRRLERRMKTRGLLARVAIELTSARSLCPQFRGSLDPKDDQIVATVSFHEVGLCVITDDWDILREAIECFGVIVRETTYAEYNRQRVLLTGWRLAARRGVYRGQ